LPSGHVVDLGVGERLQNREEGRHRSGSGSPTTIDIALEVGAAAEVVEVSGAAPATDAATNANN
jgi:hypothetical protein